MPPSPPKRLLRCGVAALRQCCYVVTRLDHSWYVRLPSDFLWDGRLPCTESGEGISAVGEESRGSRSAGGEALRRVCAATPRCSGRSAEPGDGPLSSPLRICVVMLLRNRRHPLQPLSCLGETCHSEEKGCRARPVSAYVDVTCCLVHFALAVLRHGQPDRSFNHPVKLCQLPACSCGRA